MESKRICGEIKIGTVMEPVRFGSWDLGRMGVWRGKANYIQMTGRILPNRRLDLFPLRVSFANTSKLVVVRTRFFYNLDQTMRFSVYLGKKTKNKEPQVAASANRCSPSLEMPRTSSPLRQGWKCAMFYTCLDASGAFKQPSVFTSLPSGDLGVLF